MTDPKKPQDDLDLDWDDALDAWEQDLKGGAAEAQSAPMPQTPDGAPKPAPAPARALYKPPAPGAIPPRPLPARPGIVKPPAPAPAAQPQRPNEPRPPALSSPPPAMAGRDSLFDAADDDIPTRVPTGDDLFPLDMPDEDATRVASVPRELIDSIIGPRPTPEKHAQSTKPPPPLTLGDAGGDVDDLLGGLDAETPPPRPQAPAMPRPVMPRPVVPRPGGPIPRPPATGAAKPGFSVPKPGAVASPPKPGVVAPPKPAAFAPPKPAAFAKPEPIVARPLPARPAPAPVASPPPGQTAQEAADAELDAIFGDPIPSPGATPAPAEPPPLPPSRDAAEDELDAIFGTDSAAPAEPAPRPGDFDGDEEQATTIARSPLDEPAPAAPPRPTDFDGDEEQVTTIARSPLEDAVRAAPAPAPRRSVADDEEDDLVTTIARSPLDDDEPEATVTADDEDFGEASATISVDDEDDDLDALAPSAPPAAGKPAAAKAAAARQAADRGAQTALRTVRSRKPREEVFRLVGRTPEATVARIGLLRSLAERAGGPARARLYFAAAELAGGLSKSDEARDLLGLAREADPSDVTILRAARLDASARAAWDEVASLLEAESALPIPEVERAHALALLAETRLGPLADVTGAAAAARAAAQVSPRSFTAALLLADAAFVQDDDAAAFDALARAARLTSDRPLSSALLVESARAAERAGDAARAEPLYVEALAGDDTALDAALGVARTARARGDVEPAVRAAGDAAARSTDPVVAEAFSVRAARLAHLLLGRPADALVLVADARSIPGLRARAAAAIAAGDTTTAGRALEAWAQAEGGTDRALALVELAELRGSAGDWEGADAALRDAALADSTLGTVRVMREVLARRAGDPARLARVVEASAEGGTGGAIAAAAKLGRDARGVGKERELLDRAIHEGEDPVCADTLRLDAAAQDGDVAETRAALRRQAERATPDRRVGPLLALAGLAASEGDAPQVIALLREARDGARGEALALRPLARATEDGQEAAAFWLEEAAAATGSRSAYAATEGARALLRAGADATPALRRALDVQPGYLPAEWMFEQVGRVSGDVAILRQTHERLAEASPAAREKAGRLVRAALLGAGDDPVGAVALFSRAKEIAPSDAIVRDLLLRFATEMAPAERAALLAESAAASTDPQIRRATRLRAAAAHEDALEPERAAALYRMVLAESEGDPFATEALERTELAQGDVARTAERRFASVRDATDDDSRVLALERLAELDLRDRGDPASAMMSLQALLETAPGHVPSLRALERYYLEQGRDEELTSIEQRLVEHLAGPRDIAGHARFATRLLLRPEDAQGDAADALLVAAGPRATVDLWLGRHLEAAAVATGDAALAAKAARRVAEIMTEPNEHATATVRAAEQLERAGAVADGVTLLSEAVQRAPEHPVAAEELARLSTAAGGGAAAAEALEQAAAAARVPVRVVSFWHRAAVIWQDDEQNADRAVAALEAAAAIDAAYEDVYSRLAVLLEERGENERLAVLTEARLARGGDARFLATLHGKLASLREAQQDREAAKAALRAALAIEPDRLDALRKLAALSEQDDDWRGAAEALIRIARLTKDIDELHGVFFKLGDIYDARMPDPKRAEAAFRRALKLRDGDTDSMERLAGLLEREGNFQAAVEMREQLVKTEPDPDKNRQFRLDLATSFERQGEARKAEAVFEAARRATPTDTFVLRALAEFYQRQNAQTALAMHLNRAVNDFRHAVDSDMGDAAAWHGLVEVLGWRGRPDAARQAASAATAVGFVDVDLGRLLDARGGVPGAGGAAADVELDELLAPPMLSLSTRAVFRLAGDAIEKALPPFDLKALRAERVRADVAEVARWFGLPEVEVWITATAPRVCVPVSDRGVLFGRDVYATASAEERQFLIVRAMKIARSGLATAVRSQPADLATVVYGILRSFDPNFAPPANVSLPAVDDAGRRFQKALNKRVRDELVANLYEMVAAQVDPMRLGLAAAELADRVALVATGSVPAGISALLRVAGVDAGVGDQARLDAVRRVAAARSLLLFAISDACFEARHRAGADRR